MKKCTIIYNPKSGVVKKAKLLQNICDTLEQNGFETEVIFTQYKRHAIKLAKEMDDTDLLICAGGDGTLSEVISGNLQREHKLLVASLPLGSTNDVANMYGYGNNPNQDIIKLLNGSKVNVDICMMNNQSFVYVASFGNLVNVAYETPRQMKEKIGKLAYLINGIKEFTKKIKTYDLTYRVDNKIVKGSYSFIFITNSSRVANFNNIYKDVKLDDGKFEVAFCSATKKGEIVRIIGSMLTTDLSKINGIEYYQTSKIIIELKNNKIPCCIDGEEVKISDKKLIFTVNKSIHMLVPSQNVDKLFNNT